MNDSQVASPVAALRRLVSTAPDHVVLVAEGESWTSARLADESARLAAGLAGLGVRPKDRVALHLHNTIHAALGYLACLRLGAVAVPLNTRLTTAELGDLVARTSPTVYLGEPSLYGGFAPLAQDLLADAARFLAPGAGETGGARAWEELRSRGEGFEDARVHEQDAAVLLATSGTTGPSKIVVWSHAVLGALHLSAAGRGITAGDVLPLITPLMHGAGLYHLLNALTQGATAVLVPQFDAEVVLDAMERHACTSVFGLPFMCGELADQQRRHPRRIPLRMATVAGDTCPPDVETRFREVFGLPLLSYWASAEDVGAMVTGDAVGPFMRVLPQAQVQVVDAHGASVPAGEIGELLVRSPTTIPGYWETQTAITPLPDGVFHSGDLVRQRADAVLELVGRSKDTIIRRGSNITPGEVEARLREHPQVLDAAVVGMADPDLGQRVGALLVLADDATSTPEQIVRDTGQHLAAYKLPQSVLAVDAIPRNTLTKIDRTAVLTLLHDAATPAR